MTETKIVFSSMLEYNSSVLSLHFSSTPIYTTSKPACSSFLQLSRTAGCSAHEVIILFPRLFLAYAAPNKARLAASVPPDVKNISSSLNPAALEMRRLASLIAFSADTPILCKEEGLPKSSLIY
jgi:hypothetical protein